MSRPYSSGLLFIIMMQKPTEVSDDLDIIRKVLDGDVNAFELLLVKHNAYVTRILKRHLPYDVVEEIAQEVFIRAYQSLPGFKQKGKFKSWLAAIAVRTCYDYWRKKYRNKEIAVSSLSEPHQEWLGKVISDQSNQNFEKIARQKEAREILDWALGKLSPEDRMVLELVYLEEHSVKEAAQLLGWTVANVKVRSFRARKKIHKFLTGQLEEERNIL